MSQGLSVGLKVVGKAMYQLTSNELGDSGGALTQINLGSWSEVSTVAGVEIVANSLTLSQEGTYIITNRLFTRDNTNSGSNADLNIRIFETLPVGNILEESRYYVGKPSGTFCRVSHEFTMMFKRASGDTPTTLYYATTSAVGQVVLVGESSNQYSTIEVLKIA